MKQRKNKYALALPEPALRFDAPEDSPLLVQRETADSEATRAVFSIKLKPDLPIKEGEHDLVVRSPSSAEPITIPVSIRLEPSS